MWPRLGSIVRLPWEALFAGRDVCCLGSAARPLQSPVMVQGCSGLPQQRPCAFVVWVQALSMRMTSKSGMGQAMVLGLPAHLFLEELPGKFVWRSPAAAGVQL